MKRKLVAEIEWPEPYAPWDQPYPRSETDEEAIDLMVESLVEWEDVGAGYEWVRRGEKLYLRLYDWDPWA